MVKEILEILFRVSVLTFVIGSMIAMGLSLTVRQILDPLKDKKRVFLALIANFVLVPLFVAGLVAVIPVTEGERIGLILLSLAAGAPFLPKLAGISKSNVAFSIGLMLLLMVVTIFYLPLVLPWFLSGAKVSPWAIAKSLILLMLIPLLAALFLRARAEHTAERLQVIFAKLTNLALLLLTVSLIALHTKSLISMVGPGLVAILLLLIVAMVIGYFLGGPEKESRIVLSLGTGQRNISAAILVAAQNFKDPQVTLTMIALAILGLVIMLPIAGRLGKRASAEQ
jgi:BASS family bile acid:Na+ symporter